MATRTTPNDLFRHDSDEAWDCDRFEKIARHREREWGVRSDMSRTRARLRSRGSSAARNKARSFNGVNRRGRYQHALSF